MRARQEQFSELAAELHRQTLPYEGAITVLVHDDDRVKVPEARQQLMEAATSEYICFVDDDDMVAPYYCERIYPLLDGVDYIGFRMQYYYDGSPGKPTYHSLRYKQWYEDGAGYYRNISHLNPIRRELATKVSYVCPYPEDVSWSEGMQRYGNVRSEHYIPDIMYHYYFAPSLSYGQMGGAPKSDLPRLPLDYPYIHYFS